MNSFIARTGGKKLLRKEIISRFPSEINTYVEVFGGAGWVLFGAEKHADKEIFNDIDGELINLWRCVKYHPEALQKELEWTLNSREMFQECLNHRGITDIQRAARYFLVAKESFGGDLRSFGCAARGLVKATEFLTEVSKRLERVLIENKDYADLMKVYDREGTLFYLDPPYYGAEKYYSHPFSAENHLALCNHLDGIKGKFVLSYNDHPYIRELYRDYNIQGVKRQSNLESKHGGKDYMELIITNY